MLFRSCVAFLLHHLTRLDVPNSRRAPECWNTEEPDGARKRSGPRRRCREGIEDREFGGRQGAVRGAGWGGGGPDGKGSAAGRVQGALGLVGEEEGELTARLPGAQHSDHHVRDTAARAERDLEATRRRRSAQYRHRCAAAERMVLLCWALARKSVGALFCAPRLATHARHAALSSSETSITHFPPPRLSLKSLGTPGAPTHPPSSSSPPTPSFASTPSGTTPRSQLRRSPLELELELRSPGEASRAMTGMRKRRLRSVLATAKATGDRSRCMDSCGMGIFSQSALSFPERRTFVSRKSVVRADHGAIAVPSPLRTSTLSPPSSPSKSITSLPPPHPRHLQAAAPSNSLVPRPPPTPLLTRPPLDPALRPPSKPSTPCNSPTSTPSSAKPPFPLLSPVPGTTTSCRSPLLPSPARPSPPAKAPSSSSLHQQSWRTAPKAQRAISLMSTT